MGLICTYYFYFVALDIASSYAMVCCQLGVSGGLERCHSHGMVELSRALHAVLSLFTREFTVMSLPHGHRTFENIAHGTNFFVFKSGRVLVKRVGVSSIQVVANYSSVPPWLQRHYTSLFNIKFRMPTNFSYFFIPTAFFSRQSPIAVM